MKTLILLLSAFILTELHIEAGEIVTVWEKEWDIDPTIGLQSMTDLQFINDEDQFIIIGHDGDIGSIEVRETLTGEMIDSIHVNNLSAESKIAILPNGDDFIMSVGGVREIPAGFEVRKISDFSIDNKFDIPLEGDSINDKNVPYMNRIIDMKVDPVRPYVYFILEKRLIYLDLGFNTDYYAIKVYNYETAEEVIELRKYKKDFMKVIDISEDGKFLASLNEGESYLNIWDLQSLSLIKSYGLDNSELDNTWRENVRDLKFSKINNDLIYFSGSFSKIGTKEEFEFGVFEYSIERGNHINKLPGNNYTGTLIFTDDEKILFLNQIFHQYFINFYDNTLELSYQPEFRERVGRMSKYSKKYKFFVCPSVGSIKSLQYLTTTNIESNKINNFDLSPNPANNDIKISFYVNAGSKYVLSIVDLMGAELETIQNGMIESEQYSLDYNISQLPVGVYFIRLELDGEVYTHKFIKQ